MIIAGGFNVIPNEIEQVLKTELSARYRQERMRAVN